MNERDENDLVEMKKSIDKIVLSVERLEVAVIGSPEFGHIGLVARQEQLKGEVLELRKELELVKARNQWAIGVAIGVSSTLSLLINFIKL